MEKDLNKAVLAQINIPEDTAEIFAETAHRFEELMMMYQNFVITSKIISL